MNTPDYESIWQQSLIRVTDKFSLPPIVLRVDDAIIGTLGNFSVSTGKAKAKKMFNVSALVASALADGQVLEYQACFPESKRNILYFDTEQSPYHCQLVMQRILKLAGLLLDRGLHGSQAKHRTNMAYYKELVKATENKKAEEAQLKERVAHWKRRQANFVSRTRSILSLAIRSWTKPNSVSKPLKRRRSKLATLANKKRTTSARRLSCCKTGLKTRIESIAKMMGHTSIACTQIYAQITDSKIARGMKKLMQAQ